MNLIRLVLFLGLLSGLIYACVEPYDPKINLTAEVLIVDGDLTDLSDKQVITIRRSRVFSGSWTTVAVKGASVHVVVNENETAPFRETSDGVYEAPEGFRVQKGIKYQLRFSLPDGTEYASGVETLPTSVPIDTIYDSFDANGIISTDKTVNTPANLIYVDLNDPAGEANFYRWQWTLWEKQNWCATCENKLYVVSNEATGDGNCQTPTFAVKAIYDYQCASACWEILHSTDFNIFKDTYSNGAPVIGHVSAKIPYYQIQPALLEIRQFAISKGAYQYYRIFESQTQNTGTLTDTPPAPIVGNISNLADETESVVGYFSVSSVAVKRYWLTRQNAKGKPVGAELFQALKGRDPKTENEIILPPPYGSRPPLARCVPSTNRTPVKPVGWQQ